MLIAFGHGQKIVRTQIEIGAAGATAALARTSEVAPAAATPAQMVAAADDAATMDRFGYMFTGGGLVDDPDAFAKLGAVGAAMLDNGAFPGPTGLAAVLTYFGQFVDHDITANTDRDPANLPNFSIAHPADAPRLHINSRAEVRAQLGNLRRGTLRLDTVYGDGTADEAVLRDGFTMRIGRATDGEPNDIPRYGNVGSLGVPLPDVTGMHSDFGPIDPRKLAFIGDSRNDENLVVAQLHLAFLRFHNAVAATLSGTDDERFARAKQLTQWHYQWLIVERYLAAVCDPDVVEMVKASDAARYRIFAAAHGGVTDGHAPLPIEFSVAAFRFGHSMIRGGYIFNDNFGPNGTIGPARLRELFQFTGKGGLGGPPVLPSVWIIDWKNFIDTSDVARTARPLDALLARGLDDLVNEDVPHLRSLAQRNLRRSYVLNLPTAQTVAAQLANEGFDVDDLGSAEITAGAAGRALADNGYETQTPLWFYILAEAQARGGGKRLGRLGSLIVAETLVGLIVSDADSYWRAGPDGGRWTPADAALPGEPVDSFEAFFRFAGVL